MLDAVHKCDGHTNGYDYSKEIQFKINDSYIRVHNEYPLSMSLNEYIREILNLRGTKLVCGEGGCGSCIVTGKCKDAKSGKEKIMAINSCLFPLYAANGWDFTTIEGIGGKTKGFHEIQKRLADNNGSQCGYCSPGMVMNMFSLLAENKQPSEQQIESSFDGNLCRCTGYRSILDAMKSFSSNPIDIENLMVLKCLQNGSSHACKVQIEQGDKKWYQPLNIDELNEIIVQNQNKKYRFVSGDTARGIYKQDGPWNVYINLQSVDELKQVTFDENSKQLKLGASLSINDLISIFNQKSKINGFGYLHEISSHLSKVASVPVRNTGTWSGNLSIKHSHQEFPSDVFVLFETIGALLIVNNCIDNSTQLLLPSDYLNTQMNSKYISAVILPSLSSDEYILKTFKIMPRSQNAHAYVNAGFLFKLNKETYEIVEKPTIVYGGISPSFIHATQTEEYLSGKCLKNALTLSQAFKVLQVEVNPNDDPVLASPDYRKSLATNLLYKYFCFVCEPLIDSRLKSAYNSIRDVRDVSSGQHDYPESKYKLKQTKSKLSAYKQAAGETVYVNDLTPYKNQLDGAFILTKVGACRLDKVDYSHALSMPGVVRILLAQDIPGLNSIAPLPNVTEALFTDDEILYAGQPVGLVIAETHQQAVEAARSVSITYKDRKKPILTIEEAIEAKSFHPKTLQDFQSGNVEGELLNSKHTLSGTCHFGTQHHFYLEPQVAVSKPFDDGFEIDAATQWLDSVQKSVAQVLDVKNSAIGIRVKQIGGSYGGKISRSAFTACAAALASSVLNRPVRVSIDLNDAMEMIGKRIPWYAEYEVGFSDEGKLNAVRVKYYTDTGCSPNDNDLFAMYEFYDNVYKCANWQLTPFTVKTNTPANTYCRTPGTFPATCVIEYILEHVASFLKKDPLEIRLLNMYSKNDITPMGKTLNTFNCDQIIDDLLKSSDFYAREALIKEFNANNQWKKKGISLVPLKYPASWFPFCFGTLLSVFNGDGSIAISHGGVEMGQGIHTKVAHVCANELDIPIDLISVKSTDNLINANSFASGGSMTSEMICYQIIECCKVLKERLEPIRKQMQQGYSWTDLIQKANMCGVDLTVRHWVDANTKVSYEIYGASVSEVLLDVLTGETQILRTDILYDIGKPLHGAIDIGQAEGAFVMGLGFWFSESFKYDPNTGKCLTNGTWHYKPPTTKDIPIDFRISFLKDSTNDVGVLGSKSIGEPPLILTLSAIFAVKNAIQATRRDSNEHISLSSPATVDLIQKKCEVNLMDARLFKF